MRIGIDARFWGPKGTGIGRYVKNLVLELEKIDQQHEYFVFLQKDNYKEYEPSVFNFHKVILNSHPYSLKSQLVDARKINQLQLDLVHFPHFSYPIFYQGKFIVTIHDLIKSQFYDQSASTRSGIVYQLKHKGYELVIRKAIENSERIITPTQYVKNEILKNYHIKAEKIIPIYEGAESNFSIFPPKADQTLVGNFQFSKGKITEILKRYNLEEKKYLIYVGNVYPYKNVEKLLEMMEKIRRQTTCLAGRQADNRQQKKNDKLLTVDSELSLAIVCSRSVFYERLQKRIQEMKLENQVKMLGYVPDEELVVLYHNALAFLTASLAEGFGLTGLEAMAAGCPVICSNQSSLPEVYGQAALYFDPNNINEIIKQISRIQDSEFRIQIIRKGEKQVQKYSWQKMARKILRIYEEILK